MTEPKAGTVTSLRAQKNSPDRVSVFLDGEFAFGMHRDLLLEFDVAKGKKLSVEQQREILDRDAYFRARAVAFRYLSYRERTTAEIRRRLSRDDYPPNVIKDVIHSLEQSGYLDDRAFAVKYAEGRFKSKGYGPMRIRSDLRRKGVKRGAVERAVEKVYSEQDDVLERAREMGKKRWNRLANEPDELKRKKKVYDYLARRGFSFDMVRRIVDGLAASDL